MSFGYQESKAELSAGFWVLSGDPYVMNRAYNTFPDAKRKDGKVVIRATDEAARDLQWFSTRFPLVIHPEVVMRVGSAKYTRDQHTIAQILSEGYVGEPVAFAEGESPRPHQTQAAALVRTSKRLLLADCLGTGKTVSALSMIADTACRPALVCCPPALEMQWQRSIARFLPQLTVHAIDATGVYPLNVMKKCQCGHVMDSRRFTKRGKLICAKCQHPIFSAGRNPDVVLCSYSKLMNWAEPLAKFAKSVVWEECHALRRNQSQKWEAAKTIATAVPIRLGLSATPLFNYGGEAWNVLECIAPGFLGDKATFRETWCSGYGDAGKEPPLKDPEAFGAYLRTSGVMLRRTAEDVGIKLGQHQRITVPINADANVFNEVAGRAAQLARIILDETKRTRGEQMHASGQLDNLLRQATGLAKANFVCDFVEILLEQGIPVVLFGHHHAVYEVWNKRLDKWKPAMYTGQESKLQKDASVHRFATGDTDVFICALRSGEGLDGLQFRCCTAVFGELDWTDAVHQQCSGRLYRDGQKHPVNSYFPLSGFGTDPYMAEVVGAKARELSGLMGERTSGPTKKIDSSAAIRELAAKYLNRR